MSSTTLYVEPAFFENFDGEKSPFDYTLTDVEKLCFTCPLLECKENSVKCPMNIALAAMKKGK
jgi:hypothetical protein